MNNIYKKYDFDSNTTQISTHYLKNTVRRLYIYIYNNIEQNISHAYNTYLNIK